MGVRAVLRTHTKTDRYKENKFADKNKHKFRNYFLLRYRRTYAPPIPIHVYLSRQSSSDENLFCNKVKKKKFTNLKKKRNIQNWKKKKKRDDDHDFDLYTFLQSVRPIYMQYKYNKKKIHYIFVFDMIFRDLFDFDWIVNVVAPAKESIESFVIALKRHKRFVSIFNKSFGIH